MSPATALAFKKFTDSMTIQSDLLGPIDATDEDIFSFGQGLFGFPECHEFLLIGAEQPGLFWLQSTEFSALTFVTVDPFLYFDEYEIDLSPADTRELEVDEPSDVLLLAIVTLPAERGEPATANLQGPIAFNPRTRIAKQVVLEEGLHGTRVPFRIEQPLAR